MKEKNLLLILLTYVLLLNISLQQIIIPIGLDVDSKGKKKKEEEEKPIIETREIKDNKGNNIKITRITYNRTKNLNGYSEGITPFQIIRIFDDRVNSIFDDFIRQSIGIKLLLHGLSRIDEEEEYEYENEGNVTKNQTGNEDNDFIKEFELDDEEEDEKNKADNANINSRGRNNTMSRKKKTKQSKMGKNYTKVGKLKVNLDNIKGRIKKKKKKLSRRELIFFFFFKYIFYSLILFTIYILAKKLLEFFEVIDPDNATEVKIENDEMTNLKKTSENKIS